MRPVKDMSCIFNQQIYKGILAGLLGSPFLACQGANSAESSSNSDSYENSGAIDCLETTGTSSSEDFEALPGSIVITEFMLIPFEDGIRSRKKQWIELWNATNTDISLRGWKVETVFIGNTIQEEIQCNVVIPAHGYLVLGGSVNQEINTHVSVSYAWHNKDFELDPYTDSKISILTPGGLEVDQVTWDYEQWPIKYGYTTSLDGRKMDSDLNDDIHHWCLGKHPWLNSHGNKGSPGEKNGVCRIDDLSDR